MSTSARIDLVWLGGRPMPRWAAGDVYPVSNSNPASVEKLVSRRVNESSAAAWLFWDQSLGMPDEEAVRLTLEKPGDLWHAGLKLGMAGQPEMIDFVQPSWMLNVDPPADLEATSWRMSLRAALVSRDVLQQLGGPKGEYVSLEGGALEMGHRYITSGVQMRHVPSLVRTTNDRISVPLSEELRFLCSRFGKKWTAWAVGRAVLSGYASPLSLTKAWSEAVASTRKDIIPFRRSTIRGNDLERAAVSVLIPTIDRYRYLRTLLTQLRHQTVAPCEIIVVDQTPPDRRDRELGADFVDLPLSILYQDSAGQCTSRNAGLSEARGDCVLFLDDDDEIPTDLIAAHLSTLAKNRADVSCGVADEAGAGPLPAAFRIHRISDVFPTNNGMVTRRALDQSGLFDIAYDRGQRADKDLGMRMYLDGALMVLNPEIRVFHHHAPRGGLRTHKARVVTYASSRGSIFERHLPTISEIYLARRYFSSRQRREMLWLRTFGTLSARGGIPRKLAKAIAGLLQLPHTLYVTSRRVRKAEALERRFPEIPQLISVGVA